jgi:hypothetical protein
VSVDDQRDDHHDGLAAGHGGGGVAGGRKSPVADYLLQALKQVRLARKRDHALVDSVDDGRVGVNTDNFMALAGELHGQGQTNLSQSDEADAQC